MLEIDPNLPRSIIHQVGKKMLLYCKLYKKKKAGKLIDLILNVSTLSNYILLVADNQRVSNALKTNFKSHKTIIIHPNITEIRFHDFIYTVIFIVLFYHSKRELPIFYVRW